MMTTHLERAMQRLINKSLAKKSAKYIEKFILFAAHKKHIIQQHHLLMRSKTARTSAKIFFQIFAFEARFERVCYPLRVMNDIFVHQLSCGAALIIERMAGVGSGAVTISIPGGSAFDPPTRMGRGTMWSELLLRGASALDSRAQADAFDRLGVSRSTDLGAYTLRIAAGMLGSNVVPALALMMDMVRCPRMDDESIDPCRELAIAAIDSLADDPQERASHIIRERHFQEPINRSGLGTRDGLAALTGENLRSDWANEVRPGTCIIGIAGAVERQPIIDALESMTKGWSGRVEDPPCTGTPPRGYAHENDPSNQVQIMLLHDAPPEPNPDSMLEKVVANVLSGGMAGRLFTEVREKRGLCYTVNAGYRGEKEFGCVSAYVGTTPEKAQESLNVLFEQLALLHTPQGAITQQEFDRAIIGMKSSVVFSGESTGARSASIVSDYRRLGKPRSLEEITAQVSALTLDQVNAYLARREMGRITIQTLGPKELSPPQGV